MPNQVRHDDLATFYDSIKQLKMKHQAIPGTTMNAYVKSKYGYPAIRILGRAMFLVLPLVMHVGEMAVIPLINILAAGIFMANVCLSRLWPLLQ